MSKIEHPFGLLWLETIKIKEMLLEQNLRLNYLKIYQQVIFFILLKSDICFLKNDKSTFSEFI